MQLLLVVVYLWLLHLFKRFFVFLKQITVAKLKSNMQSPCACQERVNFKKEKYFPDHLQKFGSSFLFAAKMSLHLFHHMTLDK